MVLFTDFLAALVLCGVTAFLPTQLVCAAEQPCNFVLKNADFGVVRPGDDALTSELCSWRISASPERKLVINIDHVYFLDENSVLTITIDGNETTYSNISCNEWKYKQLIGNTIQIVRMLPRTSSEHMHDVRNSTPTSSPFMSGNSTALPHECNATHFEIRYKSFDPLECVAAEAPVNGFTSAGKTNRIGEKVHYQCHAPYLPEKGSLLTASCVFNSNAQMPLWSSPPPRCILPECGKLSIKISLDDIRNKTILMLEDLKLEKLKNCMWEITTESNRYLVAHVEHLSLPLRATTRGKQQSGALLELYDDRIAERRLLARLNGRVSNTNYTTASNKLIVTLRSGKSFASVQTPPRETFNEMEDEMRHYGFTIVVFSKSPLCQFPNAPVHGDVKGLGQSNDAIKQDSKTGHDQAIVFTCNSGFYLNGSEHASCLENGQWSDQPPTCASDLLPDEPYTHSLETQTVAIGSETNVSVATEEAVLAGKTQQSRISKDQRPHPQSTEEKNNLKGFKEDSNIKHLINPHATPSPETSANFTGDAFPEDDQGSPDGVFPNSPSAFDEFDEAFPNYDRGESEREDFNDEEEDVVRDSGSDSSEFPVIAIILGVGIPLILGIVAIGAFFVYRKLYPVRMSLGRKFETFENPAYGRGKRSPGTPLSGSLLPGASLAQSPAELQRLTKETLP